MTATEEPAPARVGRLRSLAVDISPLRDSPDYRRLWVSQVVSVVGTQVTTVAVALQVYAISRSSFLVGLTGLVAFAPLLVFGLLGGAIVDAVDRRRLLQLTSAASAVVSAVLVLQAFAGWRSIPLLYVCVGAQAGLFAVDSPARRAALPRLLPAEQLPAALSLSQVIQNLGLIGGPLLAGVLVSAAGYVSPYAVDAASYVVALYAVSRLPSMVPEGGGTKAGVASVTEGLRYLRTRPVLLSTFAVDLLAMVFGMPRALFPALATGHFSGGARTAGLLYAAPAIGALVGALVSGPLGRVRRQGVAVLVAVAVWGAAIAGFGLVGALWVAVVLLAVAGAADMVSAVFRNTVLIVSTPDAMVGRLGGVFTVVVAGGPRLGDVEAGAVAALVSPGFSVMSGGVACVVGVVVVAVLVPKLVGYDARSPAA